MYKVLTGSVIDMLRTLPDKSVHCVITSPPYYHQRDYGDGTGAYWEPTSYVPMPGLSPIEIPEWQGQLGLEPTPEMYTAHLVQVFREVWRVLRDDGTVWLNLGDSYAGAGGMGTYVDKRAKRGMHILKDYGRRNVTNLKPKDLIGIPFRAAFALQADGWFLRVEVPWIKRNAMPLSVKDRPQSKTEYFILLAKAQRYYYDTEAVKVPRATDENRPDAIVRDRLYNYNSKLSALYRRTTGASSAPTASTNTRLRRASDWLFESLDCITAQLEEERKRIDEELLTLQEISANGGFLIASGWDGVPIDINGLPNGNYGLPNGNYGLPLAMIFNTQPYKEAHFAVYNPRLIEPCVLASTSPMACPKCGAPWERVVEYKKIKVSDSKRYSGVSMRNDAEDGRFQRLCTTVGWQPTCSCPDNDGTGRCTVLDPFAGSGTTLAVAEKHGRDSIGIEINPEYIPLMEKRISSYLAANR